MLPDLTSYSTIIVAFSGGKDSVACVLHLLESGVPKEKIELWHHDVDGREGSKLMDWAVTRDYCAKFATALGLKLYYSWKVGGFEGEMARNGASTAPTKFERSRADGSTFVTTKGGKGPVGTRLRFPQVSADLKVRWCSAYLKIDIGATAIRNQPRFAYGARTLVVSGERAEESSARAKYKELEPDRADNRETDRQDSWRHVDRWRPVHKWSEREVWAIMERHRVTPHPAYQLGWGRVSCAACIFGSPNQWASLAVVNPDQLARVALLEKNSGKTIQRKLSVPQLAAKGRPYAVTADAALVALATSETFSQPILCEPGAWKLPAGAFGESAGPT